MNKSYFLKSKHKLKTFRRVQFSFKRNLANTLWFHFTKTFASGAGGKWFKFRADQIAQTSTTRHCCNLWSVGPGKSAEMGTAHSWHPKGY